HEKYLDSSIFVLPSRSEGFGMVIVEAMACGVPVISFDCPHGPADIISQREDGFLVENGNREQFAARLLQLMNSTELRQTMGAKGRENVKKYLPDRLVKETDILFKDLVGNKKGNPN